jgi:hypothetical protein
VSTLEAHLAVGRFLNRATVSLPAVVLGHAAASALGVDRADGTVAVWLGNRWFDVVGILEWVLLAPELDRAALIGFPVAQSPPARGRQPHFHLRTDGPDERRRGGICPRRHSRSGVPAGCCGEQPDRRTHGPR